MKKHFLLLPFIAGLLYLALSSNSGGPGASSSVNGTGARGTTGCSCHSSAADTGIRVTLTLDSAGTPVTRYIAGRSYNITITGTNNSSSTLRGFGFQFTAVNLTGAGTSSATNAGTLATTGLPTACQNTSVSGLRLIEHSARITATSGSGGTGTTYRTSVQWTAPSAGTGSIRLYGVLQAVDASGSTTGDKWNNVMVTIGELSSSGAGTISGPTAVCVNSQITLTDSVGGGTWSSSNASIATVGATTGVVTGVGRGSVIISYGGSAMGYATTTITVNPIPSVITGSDVICVGSTATYLDSTTGGSWAISPTSVATVAGGTLTATVTAVSAGTATLSYTLSTGCSRSRAVTINPLPGTITGPNHLCAGSTANYTDTSTGITWSCSPSSVATINSSGMVTGVTAGSATITVTYGTAGCRRTMPITVDPLPSRISGPTSVCVAGFITLLDSVGGGTWSSSNTSVATINSSGLLYGVSAGTTTVTYMLTTGCYRTTTITVNGTPSAGTISGATNICLDSSGVTYPYIDSVVGGTWFSSNTAVGTINSATGAFLPVSLGTTTLTYTVTNSCGTGFATLRVNVNSGYGITTPTTGPSTVVVPNTISLSNATSGGTWSSSNTAVATVNTSGTVRAVSAGGTIITYSATASCGAFLAVKTILCTDSGVYCTPAPTYASASCSSYGMAFGAVKLNGAIGSILDTQACSGTGYLDRRSLSTTLYRGNTYSMTTTMRGSTYTMSTQFWIDFNNNAIFETTESVGGLASVSGTGTFNIVIPTGVTNGTYRMRGIVSYYPSGYIYPNMDPCMTGYTYGEARDYTVIIADPAPSITFSPTGCLDFGTVTIGSMSSTLSYTIMGSNLTPASGSLTISAPANFQVSPDGSSWSSSYTVGYSGGAYPTSTHYARFAPTAATTYTNNIYVTGGGLSTAALKCVQGTGVTGCSGTPTAGAATATVTSGCTTYSTVLSLTGASSGAGLTYQWQSSPTGTTFTNVSGATSATYTASVTATVYYRCVVTCSISGLSANSTPVTLNFGHPPAGYVVGRDTVCVGATITLADSAGTAGGTWTSSGSSIATVSTSGVVTGVAAGTTIISYTVTNTCGTNFATKVVRVLASASAGTISGPTSLCVGNNITLTSTVSGGTWYSSVPSIGSVNATTGRVDGYSAGTTTISYMVINTCGTAVSTQNITVNAAPSAGTITGASSVCQGATTSYSSTVSGGTWTSSNSTIARVDSITGVVTGVAGGTANISYTIITSCGSTSTSRTITVNPLPSAGTISGANSICVAGTSTYTDSITGGTWSITPTSVATISTSGVVTAVAVGSAVITYTTTNSCGTSTTTRAITVVTTPTAGTLSGATTVCNGASTTLTSTVTGGTWSSSAPAIASVGATSGIVTGMAAGVVTITYNVTNACSSVSATRVMTVTPSPNAGTITGTSTICSGTTTTLSNAVSGGVWSSSNTAVATVSTAGVVTGVSTGTAIISYSVTNSCGTAVAVFTMSITTGIPVGNITGTSAVCVGASATLVDTTAGGTWSSSNTAIATVSTTGVVTGVSGGAVNISYTVVNGCGTIVRTRAITINPLPTVNPISGASTVCLGSSITLLDSTTGGTWSSSNASIASVSSTGVVTGNSTGSVTISYTVTNSCGTTTVTKSVTVNPLPSSGSISGPTTVCVGSSITLVDSVVGGTWSSSSASVATISTTGVVTGVSTGTAVITYSVTTSCGSTGATRAISVIATPTVAAIAGTTTVCAGATSTLTDATSGGMWISSNAAVARVDSMTGVVIGVAAGTATITYSVANACGTGRATVTFTVNPLPNAGTISGSNTVCVGATTTLTSTVSGGTWSSSNNTLATVSTAGVVRGVATGSLTISYLVTNSCGSAIGTQAMNVTTTVSAGTISGGTTVCTGTTASLTSTVTGGTWSSSNSTVASVNATTGVVTGVSAGSATITYIVTNTCGSAIATSPMTVSASSAPAAITGSTALCVGGTTTFADATPGGVWSSSNTAIATVSATGVVSGVSTGAVTISYTITSSCGSLSATRALTVNAAASAGTLSGGTTVCTGGTTTLTSTVSGGMWLSSNPSIARVDSMTGVVTGVSAGAATITYLVSSSCGSATATRAITVSSAPTVATTAGASTVCVGSSTTLSNATTGGVWSSSNTAIATVSAGGTVVGIASGSVNISYTVTSSCGTVSDVKPMTVTATASAGTISGATTVCAGFSTSYTNTVTGGTWSSSNTTIATVNPTSGLVTGVATGAATISYTVSSSCGSAVATRAITVTTGATAGTISGATSVCTGATTTMTNTATGGTWSVSNTALATINASTGVLTGVAPGLDTVIYTVTSSCGSLSTTRAITINLTANAGTLTGASSVCTGSSTSFTSTASGGTWSSSSPAIASVNATSGLVSGVAAGTAVISYSVTTACGTAVATRSITVGSGSASAGTISGTTTVCTGSTTTLTSTVSGGTWSSANASIATVNASTGVVTGVGAGSTSITYTVTSACGTASTSTSITVNLAGSVAPISGGATICVGSTSTYRDTIPGGIWSSSNASIATVNPSTGVVTGVAAGSATITYTITSACGTSFATSPVTVSLAVSAGTISGSTSVCAGSTATYTSTVSGGTWSSSNPAVATISSAGMLTGVSAGSVVLTYTVSGGCGAASATFAVTVNAAASAGTISGSASVCVATTATYTSTVSGGTWSSSNPAVATVNPTSGVVNGLSAGSATITYTVAGSCGMAFATRVVTVSAGTGSVPPIAGPTSVCTGASITLTNTLAGGTWSSSNTAVATVNPTTGLVTGITSSNVTISYSVVSGCGTTSATQAVAVYSSTSAGTITGASSVCVGGTATVANTTIGGYWQSSNNTLATVSTTGVITGVSAGTVTISYIAITSCGSFIATRAVTVMGLPSAGTITGASSVTVGGAITLTSTVSGGTWASMMGRTSVTSSGIVTGIIAGMDSISYTVTNTCGSTTAKKAITVLGARPIGEETGLDNTNLGIKAYPNPNNGVFTIEIAEGISNADITITDISGRVVEMKRTADLNGSSIQTINTEAKSIRIDLSQLGAGMYMLKAVTPNGTYTEKINVQ